MAKAAGTLEERGQRPKVVWRTLADTALQCSSHTISLRFRLWTKHIHKPPMPYTYKQFTQIKIKCSQTLQYSLQNKHENT